MLTEKQLQELVDGLPLDELVGQVINYELGKRHDREWMAQIIRETKPGSIYYGNSDEDLCEYIRGLQDEACSVPTMYVADVEHGPGCGAPVDELLPVPKFTVEVKCDKPARVVRIGGRDRADAEVPFTWADGYAKFDVDSLVMFEMYRIK